MTSQRWHQGGFATLREARDYFRRLLHLHLEKNPCEMLPNNGYLAWLIEDAPWEATIVAFTTEVDGRGNHRFVAVARDGTLHPFSTNGALHGDWTPPRRPPNPDNPMGDLKT